MSEAYAYRFPPCPAYDMECFESWLEELASQGLVLEKDPFFGGFASFRKTTPTVIRYRLQPKPKQAGVFSKSDPQQNAIDLAKDYGWTFLGEYSDFFIFSTEDPTLPELDTDPRVQAMALIELEKRKKRELFSHLSLLLLALGLMIWDGPIRFLLEQQTWYMLVLAAVWLLYSVLCLRELRHLHDLQAHLLLGSSFTRKKDWKSRRLAHWGTAFLAIPLVILFLIGAIGSRLFDWEDRLWQPRTEPPPFSTVEDLYPGSSFVPDEPWIIEEVDHVAERTTWLADRQIRLYQNGSLEPAGAELFLRVTYYDLRTDWLAKELYDELLQTAKRGKYYSAHTIADLPTGREAAWQDVVSNCVLLQEGDLVLVAELSQYNEPTLPLDSWAAVFAKSIVE